MFTNSVLTQQMVLDTSLLNTQYYKVRIKGKVEQSRERSNALPYTLMLRLSKKEPSGRPQLRSSTLLLLFHYKDSFGIKYPRRVDKPLNKETKLNLYKFMFICMHICKYVCLYLYFPSPRYYEQDATRGYLSSSSYRAGCTDIPDPLSPLLPIVHRPR